MRNHRLLFAPTLFALALACAGDPGAEVESRRGDYTATLQSFVVQDDPGTGTQRIVLDVLVDWSGRKSLPGLTLDVSMADPAGTEKVRRRVWIETAQLRRGGEQLALVLDGLPWEPGDGFFVEVRSRVPAAERGQYREFGATAPAAPGS
ncbi:MAG: hypothetical protein AMXMBFR36_36900 [Acidobacteriota bacterium]